LRATGRSTLMTTLPGRCRFAARNLTRSRDFVFSHARMTRNVSGQPIKITWAFTEFGIDNAP
jgi:hypothetical protein